MCTHVVGKCAIHEDVPQQYSVNCYCQSVAIGPRPTLVHGPSITGRSGPLKLCKPYNLLSAVLYMIYTNTLHFVYKHAFNFTLDKPMSLDLHPHNASVWQAATTCLQTQWHSNMADQSIPVASLQLTLGGCASALQVYY